MKEAKKSQEEASATRARAIRQAWVDRQRVCGEARALLLQLEAWLAEHLKQLDHQFLRCSGFSAGPRRVVQNGTTMFLVHDPVQLAEQLIAGKALDQIILGEQEDPQLKRIYSAIRFNEGGPGIVGGEGDLAIMKKYDAEKAAVEILKAAIKIQRKAVLAKTSISMETFSRTVSTVRAETARDILAAVAELRAAAEPDQHLAEGLEPEEIDCLRPRPFPLRLLSDEAHQWLLDSVSQKMLALADLGGVQSEMVKPAPPETAELAPLLGESWLQGQV